MGHCHGRRDLVPSLHPAMFAQSYVSTAVNVGFIRVVVIGQQGFPEFAFILENSLRNSKGRGWGYKSGTIYIPPRPRSFFFLAFLHQGLLQCATGGAAATAANNKSPSSVLIWCQMNSDATCPDNGLCISCGRSS